MARGRFQFLARPIRIIVQHIGHDVDDFVDHGRWFAAPDARRRLNIGHRRYASSHAGHQCVGREGGSQEEGVNIAHHVAETEEVRRGPFSLPREEGLLLASMSTVSHDADR
jgi:hypothetical protein